MLSVYRYVARASRAAGVQAATEAQIATMPPDDTLKRLRNEAAVAQADARGSVLAAVALGLGALWAVLSLRAGVLGLIRASGWDAYAGVGGLAPADLAGAVRAGILERADAWGAITWGVLLYVVLEAIGCAALGVRLTAPKWWRAIVSGTKRAKSAVLDRTRRLRRRPVHAPHADAAGNHAVE